MSPLTSTNKRKTLHDYFRLDSRVGAKAHEESNGDVVEAPGSSRVKTFANPAGLTLLHDFITEEEEARLLDYLDRQHWRTDLARRTMHFGGTYCLMPPRDSSPATRKKIEGTILTAPDMPRDLDFLMKKMIASGLYEVDRRPEYCIVNEYRPGQGISAHVENFRFGEPVCSLTLGGGDQMRFHELEAAHDGSVRSGKASTAPRTGRREDVFLPRRSLVVLRSDARSKWQHEIVRGRKGGKPSGWRRVSLTFRVEVHEGVRGRKPVRE